MKISDIIRKIADHMDQQTGEHPSSELPGNVEKSADKFMSKVGEVPHTDHGNPNTMIPPLQQKIELLKKASGIPNAYDDGVGHSGKHNAADVMDKLTHDGEHDELDDIRKIAGLTVMIDGPQGEMGE